VCTLVLISFTIVKVAGLRCEEDDEGEGRSGRPGRSENAPFERCDRDGVVAYTETQKEANVSW